MSKPQPSEAEAVQTPSRTRRLARTVFIFAVAPYLGITLLFTLAQRWLIYHPTKSEPLTVEAAGFDSAFARDVTLTTDDGLTLHGWLLQGQAPTAPAAQVAATSDVNATPQRPLVIYFPGNASNRGGRINDFRDFTRLGCDVLIFDYRGYAENPGSPNETAMMADACAVCQFAIDTLETDPSRIVLFGESLGGAVAVSLAAKLCDDQTPPAALITNATFDSLPSVSAHHYPLFPFRWLVWDCWRSDERIAAVTCPLLMFHGSADRIVPIKHGRSLFAAAPPCSAGGYDKTFLEIPAAGHNDIPVSRLQDNVQQLLSHLRGSL